MSNDNKSTFVTFLKHISSKTAEKFEHIKSYIEKKVDEHEDKKIERSKERLAKDKETRLEKFYKHLNIPENATQEEINDIVLNAFSNADESSAFIMPLSPEQLKNPSFLTAFYTINPEFASMYQFTPHKDLHSDIDFMAKYTAFKFEHKKQFEERLGIKKQKLDYYFLERIPNIENLLQNHQYVESLGEYFPSDNILKVTNDYLYRNRYLYTSLYNEKQAEEAFNNLVDCCSLEFLTTQAEKFGKDFIALIRKEDPDYMEVMDHAISCDGFKSLATLTPDDFIQEVEVTDGNGKSCKEQILNPVVKSLILTAYEKDGFDGLNNFVNSTLSPNRYETYMCHGEIHDMSYYSDQHAKVKDLVIYDPDIYTIFAEKYISEHETPEVQ